MSTGRNHKFSLGVSRFPLYYTCASFHNSQVSRSLFVGLFPSIDYALNQALLLALPLAVRRCIVVLSKRNRNAFNLLDRTGAKARYAVLV